MPNADLAGKGTSRPRVHTNAPDVPGTISSPPRPTSLHRSTAHGLRTTNESAPPSTRIPATSTGRSLPPGSRPASRTVTSIGRPFALRTRR